MKYSVFKIRIDRIYNLQGILDANELEAFATYEFQWQCDFGMRRHCLTLPSTKHLLIVVPQ